MTLRYLFGPVDSAFAREFLAGPYRDDVCRTFDFVEGADVTIAADGSWEAMLRRLDGWRPDFIALNLHYRMIPDWLWTVPVPIIALAGDWNLLWHHYQHVLPRCDRILTDLPGVERLNRIGITTARPMILYGLGRSFLDHSWRSQKRDIDVLFVGNLHPGIHRDRMPWLNRLAKFSEQWKIHIATGVFGSKYRDLINRSRIVWNRSIRGEANQRTFETLAGGALLFQEADNREVPDLLIPEIDFVPYTDQNFEDKLAAILSSEDQRKQIADAGHAQHPRFAFEVLWSEQVSLLEQEWRDLQQSAARRVNPLAKSTLLARAWQQVSSSFGQDTLLLRDLEASLRDHPRSSSQLNARAFADRNDNLVEIARTFQEAWLSDPANVVAGMNLAVTLAQLDQKTYAIEQAERTLAILELIPRLQPTNLDAIPYPAEFDGIRLDWELAAWKNAGEFAAEDSAKRRLIRCRLLSLLAELKGDWVAATHVIWSFPELATVQKSLLPSIHGPGPSVARLDCLRIAVQNNPFDLASARALHQDLAVAGRGDEMKRLEKDRRLLAAATAGHVPFEPWFAKQDPERLAPTATETFRLVWQGNIDSVHSLAHVNRQVAQRLIERGHHLSFRPPSRQEANADKVVLSECFQTRRQNEISNPDFVIRHQWPPDFSPESHGHLIIMQPWEFGSLPVAWAQQLRQNATEIWVPSTFVRNAFLQAGLLAEQVHVIPYGIPQSFFERTPRLFPLRTQKKFKFLFVGGTIHRKGFDLLLKAYGQVFSAKDDVCLVVKDMGVGTFYQGRTADGSIAKFLSNPIAPEVEYLNASLSDEEMADLYARCDCLVQPFRGEGFCLPIIEAMACGLPVIVTGFGPTLDYCDADTAFLLPARAELLPEKRIDQWETIDFPFLAQPDQDALRHYLRFVMENQDLAKIVGEKARSAMQRRWTWEHAVQAMEQRLWRLNDKMRYAKSVSFAANTSRSVPTIVSGISLTMIVKNEESNLGDCLRSVADLVDEIVIVDTGSTDRTKEIAAEFGAKIFDFPWIDDFAAARNESLRHASKEWIFWMDADDQMDDAGRDAFRRTVAQLSDKVSGYVMKCLCLPDRETGTTTVVDHIRLFRNLPEIRWKYRIHEQILPAIRKLGGEVVWTDVVVHHTGYQELALKSKKRQRDLRLLKLEVHENPDDPFTLFNLGQIHQEEGQLNDALTCFQRSVKLSHPHDSIVRKLYSLMTQILRHQGKPAESLETCLKGKEHYPNDPELLFQEGLTRQDLKDWGGAKDCYGRILAGSSEKFFASSDPGLRSYKARHNLGVVCRELKDDESAEEQWKLAVAEAAHFIPSLNALGELYLAKQRWNALDDIIRRLKIQPSARLTSEILDGRRFLAMKNFKLAQETLESAVQSHPDAQIPRVLLSYVFLQSGNWVAAEALLRDILLRYPNHAESRQNLDLLLSRRLENASVRPRISLCMIVRNEEAHLGRCLESIRDIVDEIIITDTGSTDGTKSLAERFGARVIDLTWPDSFAHARTESVKSARGEWVLYLDADEFLDNQNRDRFLKLRNNLVPNRVYMMRQVSESAPGSGVVWATDHARLFPNLPNLQWTFRVHEQILGFLLGQGCEMTSTDIHIQHSGFVDAALKRQKLQRNLQLLLEDLRDYPDNGFVWFNRATCHFDLGENEEAATCLDRAIRLTLPNVSFVSKAHVLLIMAHRRLGRLDDALAQVERALQLFPSHQEILLEKGAVLAKLDRPLDAIISLEQALGTTPHGPALGLSADSLADKAHHQLARLYCKTGQIPIAKQHARAAIDRNPNNIAVWQTLGTIMANAGQIDELRQTIDECETKPWGILVIPVLQAILEKVTTRNRPS